MNLDNRPAEHRERSVPTGPETAYDRLTAYGFARRYVKGKVVANIDRKEVGYGSHLLAHSAQSVTGLSDLHEAIALASAVYSAPNVSYRRVNLPQVPLSEAHFDVVVAFGVVENLEHPEDLLKEARRILKEDGVLVISALDKQTNTNDGRDPGGSSTDSRRETYVPQFREMLEGYFGHVRLYRQGAVAGGFVFPASGELTEATLVEMARFTLSEPHFGAELPVTRSVIAVCSDAAEALGQEEEEKQAYLLLDRDRRVFDECEERAEDMELLRGEIRQMQETEVQAFVDAIKVRQTLIQELPRYLPHMQNIIREHLIHRRNIIRGNIYAIRRKGAKGLAKGAFRRSAALYRRLKTRDSD